MTPTELMNKFQEWSLTAAGDRVNRPWCTFGMEPPFNLEEMAKLFDRSKLVNKYVERYNDNNVETKKPHTYIQTQINLVYGMHKAFVARHKTRMQVYRDDSSQKAFHTRRAVMKAFTDLTAAADAAEK